MRRPSNGSDNDIFMTSGLEDEIVDVIRQL